MSFNLYPILYLSQFISLTPSDCGLVFLLRTYTSCPFFTKYSAVYLLTKTVPPVISTFIKSLPNKKSPDGKNRLRTKFFVVPPQFIGNHPDLTSCNGHTRLHLLYSMQKLPNVVSWNSSLSHTNRKLSESDLFSGLIRSLFSIMISQITKFVKRFFN